MLGYDDIAAAAAGEERDALWRSLAEDMAEASGRRGRGFVSAERPADLERMPKPRTGGPGLGRSERALKVLSDCPGTRMRHGDLVAREGFEPPTQGL